jgi:hypothetical protein
VYIFKMYVFIRQNFQYTCSILYLALYCSYIFFLLTSRPYSLSIKPITEYGLFFSLMLFKRIEHLKRHSLCITPILLRPINKESITTTITSFHKKKSCINLELDSTALQARKDIPKEKKKDF